MIFNVEHLLRRAQRGLVTQHEVDVAPGTTCRLPQRKPYVIEQIDLGASPVAVSRHLVQEGGGGGLQGLPFTCGRPIPPSPPTM